jgi:Family of unknown function (DUF6232)
VSDQEQTLLDTHGCRLTTRRLITPDGATYALHQVTSTRLEWHTKGTAPAGCLGIVALGSLAQGTTGSIAVGVAAVLLAVLVLRYQYTEYSLYLTAAGGEKQAITSRDRAFMLSLREALNDAIAKGSA